MKLLLVIFIVVALLISEASSGLFSSNSCKIRTKLCQADKDCCPVKGSRMVCGPQLEICETKKCCITEVEEQKEKQAAVIRNRKSKQKSLEKTLDKE